MKKGKFSSLTNLKMARFKKLNIVGVTGTNGKTTIATLLFRLYRKLGYNVALVSTVENRINEKTYKTNYTTPPANSLNKFLQKAVRKGVKYVFMECSSHGIHQKRIAGINFTGGIFTNLTQDHLDYHGTMDKYAKAKKKFFDSLPKEAFALSNMDDKYGKYILSGTKAKKYFYSLRSPANFTEILNTQLIGKFNKYNVLAVYATAVLLGAPKVRIKTILKSLEPPVGRLELVESKRGSLGVVDYAHTPDALKNVLETLRNIYRKRKIITVVGCGGDRDKTKRPIMGKIAVDLSNYVIFTSDNPRSESPKKILKDITSKLVRKNKYECQEDRAEAIKKACDIANARDIILIAGKGHEDYQILRKRKIHFSDKKVLERFLK